MRSDMMKRMICLMLAMVLLFSTVPVNTFAIGTESTQETETTSSVTTGFEGKTFSILGDSISTYQGVSNDTSHNSTIGDNYVYYTEGKYDPVNVLTEAGAGKVGADSGLAYEWVRQNGDKVWIVNAAHGGTGIGVWQDDQIQFW